VLAATLFKSMAMTPLLVDHSHWLFALLRTASPCAMEHSVEAMAVEAHVVLVELVKSAMKLAAALKTVFVNAEPVNVVKMAVEAHVDLVQVELDV
jgi:hypothetical protein